MLDLEIAGAVLAPAEEIIGMVPLARGIAAHTSLGRVLMADRVEVFGRDDESMLWWHDITPVRRVSK